MSDSPRTDALIMGTHYDQFNAIAKLTVLCRQLEQEGRELVRALQAMETKANKQNWQDSYPDELQQARDAIDMALGK